MTTTSDTVTTMATNQPQVTSKDPHTFMGHFKLPYRRDVLGEFNEIIGYKDELGHVTVAFKALNEARTQFVVAMDFCSPKDQFNRKRAGNIARARLVRPNQQDYRFVVLVDPENRNLREVFKKSFDVALKVKKSLKGDSLDNTMVDYVPSWAKRVLTRCLKEDKLPETTRKYKGQKRSATFDEIVKHLKTDKQ